MTKKTLITGFPRIGEKRELKKALEKFWAKKISAKQLQETASNLRKQHLQIQRQKGIEFISCNDFSYYDQMLDTCIMLNAIPARFRHITDPLDQYFAMARGIADAPAMEMTKWFNTNYHYIVPELDKSIKFHLNSDKILDEYKEAKALGIKTKINVIGPITFLELSKKEDDTTYYIEKILPLYEELLDRLSPLDDEIFVQFEEAYFVTNPTKENLALLQTLYTRLTEKHDNVKLIVTTYFEHSVEATKILAATPIWGIGLDFVHGPKNMEAITSIKDKYLIAGLVNGRNIWRNDLTQSLSILALIEKEIDKERIILSTSCSLLHSPYTVKNEPDSEIKDWLAFSYEKLDEISLLARLFHNEKIDQDDISELKENKLIIKNKRNSSVIFNSETRERIKNLTSFERKGDFATRNTIQQKQLKLPILPTTTIGSFPQTKELRKIRRDYKKEIITKSQYEEKISTYILACIKAQEKIGLDVLVHGEPERNDMVEYFGEQLNGFHFTKNGWVQSYGSRCVKPPIIYGDISRNFPMTVKWITFAQSLTKKPVKGMLTGPVTILNWSFVRDDMPRAEVARQIAVVLRDEINDLQKAGIKILQVDEAAFREGYPLRKENIENYETWAVQCFKLTVSIAEMETQIHTHMCYSEFNTIIKTLNDMDADVITIETARSGNEFLKVFTENNYKNEIGPGVYDIHSPRIPSVEEFSEQIKKILEVLPKNQLWINPDCGLKTRKWKEVIPALENMVKAVKQFRQ